MHRRPGRNMYKYYNSTLIKSTKKLHIMRTPIIANLKVANFKYWKKPRLGMHKRSGLNMYKYYTTTSMKTTKYYN